MEEERLVVARIKNLNRTFSQYTLDRLVARMVFFVIRIYRHFSERLLDIEDRS